MSKMAQLLLLVSIHLLILTGCGESNPLIGRWQDVSDEAIELEKEGFAVVIEFTKTSMIMGEPGSATHFSVTYEMHDDHVLVKNRSGNDVVVELEGENHISIDTPYGKSHMERQ